MKIGISIIFVALCFPLWAQDIPDFSANYKVNINGLQAGELKRSLSTQRTGIRIFKSETQAKGIFAFFKPDRVTETSQFIIKNTQIIPQTYLYQRTGGKKEKYLKLDFDWSKKQVNIDDKKHPWTLAIDEHTLDKLIYQIALMTDLSEEKKHFSYRIADGGKIKNYAIIKLGKETITTPLGKIETIKLTRKRDKKNSRKTTLWCAPKLHFLPVKLEHIEKGGAVFTAELRRLKGIDYRQAFHSVPSNKPAFGQH